MNEDSTNFSEQIEEKIDILKLMELPSTYIIQIADVRKLILLALLY